MAFDRLVQALDEWAGRQQQPVDVLAQVGQSTYPARHIRTVDSLSPAEFRQTCATARLIVAHAGMGSVLTALELARPLVLLPRRGDLQETRNDHQMATARWLAAREGIWVAEDAFDLGPCIDRALSTPAKLEAIDQQATSPLLDAIDRFLCDGTP